MPSSSAANQHVGKPADSRLVVQYRMAMGWISIKHANGAYRRSSRRLCTASLFICKNWLG